MCLGWLYTSCCVLINQLQIDLSCLQSIYISFLMRKDKLVKYFRELQIFKDDIQFPAEVNSSLNKMSIYDNRINNYTDHCIDNSGVSV